MIREILNGAHRLDEWLGRRLGRPYHAILGVGLITEIVRRLREFGDVGGSTSGILRVTLAILLFAVLLIHQLGELREHFARRVEKGANVQRH